MTDTTFIDRVSRLVAVRIDERRDQVRREATAIGSRMSARGVLMSSSHAFELQKLYSRELDVRAIIVWETIVRVHKTLSAPTGAVEPNAFIWRKSTPNS